MTRVTDVIAPDNINQRLTRRTSSQRFRPLMGRKLQLPPKLHPASMGPLASLISAGLDKVSLKLRQPAKHRQHQPCLVSNSAN